MLDRKYTYLQLSIHILIDWTDKVNKHIHIGIGIVLVIIKSLPIQALKSFFDY